MARAYDTVVRMMKEPTRSVKAVLDRAEGGAEDCGEDGGGDGAAELFVDLGEEAREGRRIVAS